MPERNLTPLLPFLSRPALIVLIVAAGLLVRFFAPELHASFCEAA